MSKAKEILESQLNHMEREREAMGKMRWALVRGTEELEELIRAADDDDLKRGVVRSLRSTCTELVAASLDLERVARRIEGKSQ